jgi:hypothetical protein
VQWTPKELSLVPLPADAVIASANSSNCVARTAE